jgi:prephenate dehydratase
MKTLEHEPVLLQGDHRYSFHAQAAEQLGIPEDRRVPMPTFPELYTHLRRAGGFALTAVVNSTMGPVRESYDQVCDGDLTVCMRTDLSIVHPLFAAPGATEGSIRYVHTQRPAYLQCLRTLLTDFSHVEWVPENDTAGSAWAALEAGVDHAAITPQAAGEAAGLVRLRAGMQDNANNTTTFLLVACGDTSVVPEEADVTVAVLDRVTPGVLNAVRERIQGEFGGDLRPLHPDSARDTSLIVELPGINYYGPQGDAAMGILANVASVRRIGGYARELVTV